MKRIFTQDHRKKIGKSKIIYLTGKRFGKLVVLKHIKRRSNGSIIWKCLCDCGNNCFVVGYSLKRGHTKSCGCLQRKLSSIRNRTHGMRETKIYKTWRGIVERCYNLKNKNYNDYGGRGIKCLWNSFENFRDDMYKSYLAHVKEFGEKNTSIDRINNNGNYCKENCRWATRVEQANNTRRNKIIILRGRAQTLSQWSKEKNISISTLWRRLKQGWSEEKTILTLIKK